MSTKPALAEVRATIIRPSVPFDPAALFGCNWTIWRGPADGNGREGEEECDQRSWTISELDLSQVTLDVCLRDGEDYTDGEERHRRLKAEKADHVRLDPDFAVALRGDPGKYPDPWKRTTQGEIIFVHWDGYVLRHPGGYRASLVSAWRNGRVEVFYVWLDNNRNADNPSALLASKHLGHPA
jgi:hypothetical protein